MSHFKGFVHRFGTVYVIWVCRLILERSMRGEGRRVAVLSTHLTPAASTWGMQSVASWYAAQYGKAAPTVQDIEVFLAPLNMRNSHWVLLAVDLVQSRTLWYDSMGGNCKKAIVKQVLDYIKSLAST